MVVELGEKILINISINISSFDPSHFKNEPDGVYHYFEPPLDFYYQHEENFVFISTDLLLRVK